jgi:hypothetical protein
MIINSKHSTDLYSPMFAKCIIIIFITQKEVYVIFLINISVFNNISIISLGAILINSDIFTQSHMECTNKLGPLHCFEVKYQKVKLPFLSLSFTT